MRKLLSRVPWLYNVGYTIVLSVLWIAVYWSTIAPYLTISIYLSWLESPQLISNPCIIFTLASWTALSVAGIKAIAINCQKLFRRADGQQKEGQVKKTTRVCLKIASIALLLWALWSSIMVVKLLRSNTPINPIGIISFGTYLTMAIGVATILEQSTAKLKTL